jgi:hypothetical protein
MVSKALSVRAPWWWFILHGGKTHENRDWYTSFRGRTFLHASKWWAQNALEQDTEDAIWMMEHTRTLSQVPPIDLPAMRSAGGCIVGSIEIVDCVSTSSSPWFRGKFGFVLENPVSFTEPIPCKGALGFFDLPEGIVAQLQLTQRL